MLLLVGFTIIHKELGDNKTGQSAGIKELSNNTQTQTAVKQESSFIQFLDKGRMTASWYGPKFHGKLTANGEIYNQMAFTAAHKSFKFGTLLKLTNPKNSKSVIVRINDRGPYIGGRQLDLSKGAALALGIIRPGVLKLKVEEIALADENKPLLALN
ncbi:MAG: septal ring lytic transglycosylase RlpA family protein [Ignavibacteria bacterium]|jgi:rare lipoprotein A|nr:septal ring lytic transglycosylase RlpA family protein [Ignavibacteria bacterium]MCU7500099.1 septal ring lytic transglycosylase RlpA family protein [Ignavibacteria bacterium]MCU7513834.1 septal ring lytic transglycosylase RlpA family protein [Ignavibacteria bacterium]MCU7520835.1 septal ring lytic transglycosylase RlpA family protein [Ignavibacteria bacterium]MCU7525264.1 septal ring lytic transglycosylase RlpA family protein [Ignavibacteria bacterium]